MNFKIRRATFNDVKAIVKLNQQLADYHKNIDRYYKPSAQASQSFKQRLLKIINQRNTKILVAEIENKIIAYFIGTIEKPKPFLMPQKIGHIYDAFVHQDYRQLGLGKIMLKDLIKWFGLSKIKLNTLNFQLIQEIKLASKPGKNSALKNL